MKTAFIFATALAAGWPLAAAPEDAPQPPAWPAVVPKLEEILDRQERHDELPDNAWLASDKPANRAAIDALLDEAVAILSTTGKDYRAQIGALESAIEKERDAIAAARTSQLGAPQQSWWQNTAEDYAIAIGEAEARIDGYRQRMQAVRQAFAAELRAQGLDISDEQLEFLLSTVIGGDLVGLSVAFDNVKAITVQLEQLLVDSGEELASARRYYGLYAVLLEALSHMHRHVLDAVARYVRDLDTIVDRTRGLMGESQALKRRDKRHQRTLQANIDAQKLTLRTADLYRDYLVEQGRHVSRSQKKLQHDLAVARNTYETVKVSGELVQLIHDSEHLLDSLFSRQAPALFTFQNLEMKREFERLTTRLKEGREL